MPRPGRAYWKGFLRLSLVSIPVEIYNAINTAAEIQLNQIHKPSGRRVNYIKTVKGIGPIESGDIIKGYEIDRDIYVTLEPEEIESLKVESRRTLDLQQFIDPREIDLRYFEKPYYIVPADEHAAEGYLVIREALRALNKLGVGQITMGGREHVVTVGPVEDGLVMEVLRYAQEIRPPKPYFSDLPDLKLDPEMVGLARELIAKKAAPFAPDRFHDTYAEALRSLIDKKAKGQRVVARPTAEAPQGQVINLMDALKKSLKDQPKGPSSAGKKAPAKSGGGRARAAS